MLDQGALEDGEQSVKVMLRVRPFNAREIKIHEEKSDSYLRSVVEMPEGMAGVVNFLEKIPGGDDEYATSEVFQFDKSFWSIPLEMHPYKHKFCSQETVYDHVGAPALRNAWDGFNTCIFAYGQTGAGKTFSMMGPFTFEQGADEISGSPGVIPRLCQSLYRSIEKKRQEQEEDNPLRRIRVSFETELSAYEIYNERVRDLFYTHTPGREPGEELKVRKHPTEGPFVDKISKLSPTSWQECLHNIEQGNEHRTVGATAMNADSSRSHSVFQVKFIQVETSIPKDKFEKPVTNRRFSVINLIDLAGSERNKKSQATGERLVEAASINLSLSTLKRVIDALVHNSQHPKHPHQVPYRDSVLTMLLSHSLGGNSKTMMVACVSPHYDNQEETLNTLRYASAARKIVNVVKANEDSQAKQNLLLKEQLQQLQEALEREQAGEASPEVLMDLEDQMRIGQENLQQQQENLREAEEAAQRLMREKEEEQHKRYQAAFQHSFQMVILRRQKDEAVQAAKEAEALRAELAQTQHAQASLEAVTKEVEQLRQEKQEQDAGVASYEKRLKEAIDTERATREQVLRKAYGLRWVEKHRREQELKTHEQKLQETIAEAARQHRALTDRFAERESAFAAKIEHLNKEVAQLEAQLEKEDAVAEEARASVDKLQTKHERDLIARDRTEAERLAQAERSAVALRRDIEAIRAAHDRMEKLLREEGDQRAADVEQAISRRISKLDEEWQEQFVRADEEHRSTLQRAAERQAAELSAQEARYQQAAADLERRREAVQTVFAAQAEQLGELAAREGRYRQLLRVADAALEGGEREGSSRELKGFLAQLHSFQKCYTANALNRAAIERVRKPLQACRTASLPCVALSDTVGGAQGALGSPPRERIRSWSPSAARREAAASSSARRTGPMRSANGCSLMSALQQPPLAKSAPRPRSGSDRQARPGGGAQPLRSAFRSKE